MKIKPAKKEINPKSTHPSVGTDLTVTKANQLIQQTRFSLSLIEQKILLRLIAMIDPNEQDPHPTLCFDLYEFTKLCGNEVGNGNNYSVLREYLRRLRSQSFCLYDPKSNTETILGWIDNAKVDYKKCVVYVTMNTEVMPFLTNLKSLYTTYSINYVMALHSSYAIRFYELIKSWDNGENNEYRFLFQPVTETIDTQHIGWRYKDFELPRLKDMLSAIPEQGNKKRKDSDASKENIKKTLSEQYKNFNDFKRFVLDKAFSDINQYTDMDVDFIPLSQAKGRRRVTHIRIFLKYKHDTELSEINASLPSMDYEPLNRARKGNRKNSNNSEKQSTVSDQNVLVSNALNESDIVSYQDFRNRLIKISGCTHFMDFLTTTQRKALETVFILLFSILRTVPEEKRVTEKYNCYDMETLNSILKSNDCESWFRAVAKKYDVILSDKKGKMTKNYYLTCLHNDMELPQRVIMEYGKEENFTENKFWGMDFIKEIMEDEALS